MYKFTDLNINHFSGRKLEEISIGEYNLLFQFGVENFINVFGEWKIFNEDGSVLDSGNAEEPDSSSKVQSLLQSKFESYSISNPEELHIKFSNGLVLVIYDNDPDYECCAISPDIYV
jgi:hypothetical protein